MRSKFPSQFCWVIFLVTILGPANLVHSQTTAPPTKDAAAAWKSATLAEITAKLARVSFDDSTRIELESRQAWLKKWIPGQVTDMPRANSNLPKPRIEPILESDLSKPLRKQLTWDSTLCDNSDIALLQQTLIRHPNDLGLQQLHVHWLDVPLRRKQHLGEIDTSARRFIKSLAEQQFPSPEIRLATEFAMYRLARALAYRELPDVVSQLPIKDPKQLNQQILLAYNNLIAIAGTGHSEFILLEIRILRRAENYGQALVLLEKYGSVIKRQWYLKKRRDLLKELEWKFPHTEAARIYARDFPEEKTQ